MKNSGWVKIDKGAVKLLFKLDRPYSEVEALFSHAVDVDCGREWSINGYATLWKWSRGKVRRFVSGLRTGSGHVADRKRTGSGHPIHLISNGLQDEADRKRTGSGQEADRKQDTTKRLKTKTETKDNKKTFSSDSVEYRLSILLLSEIKANNPGQKEPNIQAWASQVDRMIRIDKRDPQIIANVIDWCQRDSFWFKNILSTAKLREKFDRLVIGMKEKPGKRDDDWADKKAAKLRAVAGGL